MKALFLFPLFGEAGIVFDEDAFEQLACIFGILLKSGLLFVAYLYKGHVRILRIIRIL